MSERLNVCTHCLKEYKASKTGVLARRLWLQDKNNTAIPFGKGRWPAFVYHQNGGGALCTMHQRQQVKKVRAAYSERDALVKSLGFTSYKAYLGSELWASIRTAVFARSSACKCGRKPNQVHHLSYDLATLKGEDTSKLVALCKLCHHEIEFHSRSGGKLTPKQAAAAKL